MVGYLVVPYIRDLTSLVVGDTVRVGRCRDFPLIFISLDYSPFFYVFTNIRFRYNGFVNITKPTSTQRLLKVY